MEIKWWHYPLMAAMVLFVHPFLMLRALVCDGGGLDVAVKAFLRSFMVPLAIAMLPSETPGQELLVAFALGWWACHFVTSARDMTHAHARFMAKRSSLVRTMDDDGSEGRG